MRISAPFEGVDGKGGNYLPVNGSLLPVAF